MKVPIVSMSSAPTTNLRDRLAKTKSKAQDVKVTPPVEEEVVEEVVEEQTAKKVAAPKKSAAPKVTAAAKKVATSKPAAPKKPAEPKVAAVKRVKSEESNSMDEIIESLMRFKEMSNNQRKLFTARLMDDAGKHAAASEIASTINEVLSVRAGKTLIRRLDEKLLDHIASLDLGIAYSSTKSGRSIKISPTDTPLLQALDCLSQGYTTREHISLFIKVLPIVTDIKSENAGDLPTSKVLLLDDSWSLLDSTVEEVNKNRQTPIDRKRIKPRDLAAVFEHLTSELTDEERERAEEDYATKLAEELSSLELVVKNNEKK